MENEITSAAMQRLLSINRTALNGLLADGIAVRGEKRGTYRPETITWYCEHLRDMAAGLADDAT